MGKVVTAFPELDWDRLLHTAESAGLRRILMLGLVLARDIMAIELPSEAGHLVDNDRTLHVLKQQVEQGLVWKVGDDSGFVAKSLFHLKAKERLVDRMSYLLIRAGSPTIEDWQIVDLPDRLYFGYYLLRPLRLFGTGIVAPLVSRLTAKRRHDGQAEATPAALD